MTIKVKAVSVRVMELFTEDGRSLGLFRVDSEWYGMRRLVRIVEPTPPKLVATLSIPSLVVDLPLGQAESEIFGTGFGDHRAELDVVKVSPSIAGELLEKQA